VTPAPPIPPGAGAGPEGANPAAQVMGAGMHMADLPGLDALGRFTDRREAEAVRGLLAKGESVRHAVQGRLRRRHGLLVATDRRLLWAASGLVAQQALSWPYGEVEQVTVQVESPDVAAIELDAGAGEPVLFDCVDKRAAQAFAEAVQRHAPHRTFRVVEYVDDPREASDPDEGLPLAERRLRRLDRMHAKGSITAAEYRDARARLLRAAGLPPDLPPPQAARRPEPLRDIPPWPGSRDDPKVRRYPLGPGGKP
jgi:hypothetical protein